MKRASTGRGNGSKGAKGDNRIKCIVYTDEYVIWIPFIYIIHANDKE